jgi:hypothetical protein
MTSKRLFVVLVRAIGLMLTILVLPVVAFFAVQGEDGMVLAGPIVFAVLACALTALAPWLASRFRWPDDDVESRVARPPREWMRAAERLVGLACVALAVEPLAGLVFRRELRYEGVQAGLFVMAAAVLLFRGRMPREKPA